MKTNVFVFQIVIALTLFLQVTPVLAQNNVAISSKEAYTKGKALYFGNGVAKDRNKAFESFTIAAKQGNAGAQYYIGFMLAHGQGCEKNEALAVDWYQKAVAQGRRSAQTELGSCFQFGKGVPIDLAKAVSLYRRAAEQGDAKAQYSLGKCYRFGTAVDKDRSTAKRWFRKAAEQGHAGASDLLFGCMFPHRPEWSNSKQDFEVLIDHYTPSASQGDVKSQKRLAVLYGSDISKVKDLKASFKWHLAAAEQGDDQSIHEVGDSFAEGRGVAVNLERAVHWYRKAKFKDHTLRSLYEQYENAKEYISFDEVRNLTIERYSSSPSSLAELYESGLKGEIVWIEPDLTKAIQQYERASDYRRLIRIYETKDNGVTDLAKAHFWRQKSAADGHSRSQNELAEAYEKGVLVAKDIEKAVLWHQKAAVDGDSDSWSALLRIQADKNSKTIYAVDFEKLFEIYINKRWVASHSTFQFKSPVSNVVSSLASLGYSTEAVNLTQKVDAVARSDQYPNEIRINACFALIGVAAKGATVDEDLLRTTAQLLSEKLQAIEGKGDNFPGETIDALSAIYRKLGESNKEELMLRRWRERSRSYLSVWRNVDHAGHRLIELFVSIGEPKQAIEFLEKACASESPLWNVNDLADADVLVSAYLADGRPQEALAVYEKALGRDGISIRSVGFADELMGRDIGVAIKLAQLLRRSGRLRESQSLFEAVLKDEVLLNDPGRSYVRLIAKRGLAITLSGLGQHPKALVMFRENDAEFQVLQDRMKSRLTSPPGAILYARSLAENGNSIYAEQVIQKRIADESTIHELRKWHSGSTFETSFNGFQRHDYNFRLRAQDSLTDFYISDGQTNKALTHQDEQVRDSTAYAKKRIAYLPQRRRETYLADNYHRLLVKSLALGNRLSSDPKAVSMSATWLLNGKSIAQEALTASNLDIPEELTPKVKQLKYVRAKLAAASLMNDELAKKKTTVEALGKELDAIESEVTYQQMLRHGVQPWIEMEDFRSRIPKNSTFVNLAKIEPHDFEKSFDTGDTVVLKPRYVAWVIPSGNKDAIKFVDLGEAASIDLLVKQVRGDIAAVPNEFSNAGEIALENKVTNNLSQLANKIYHPIAKHLGPDTELILSLDSELWTVPWEILQVDGKYLVEQRSIRYLTSGRELVKTQQANSQPSAPVIFANPTYDLSATQMPQLQPDLDSQLALRSQVKMKFAPLQFSQHEAQAIAPAIQRFTNTSPVQFLRAQAGEAAFKRLVQPKLVVISTHGFFQRDKSNKNPLLKCGLAFAGANNQAESAKQSKEDGILTGLEIVGTDLRGTELVVLSACDTGVGDVRNGEGVAGLRQAFQLAGAESVLASLWQVDDAETTRLMNQFFDNLASGMPKSQALRQAQLTRIKARRARHGAAHPFFWAAFTLTGQI